MVIVSVQIPLHKIKLDVFGPGLFYPLHGCLGVITGGARTKRKKQRVLNLIKEALWSFLFLQLCNRKSRAIHDCPNDVALVVMLTLHYNRSIPTYKRLLVDPILLDAIEQKLVLESWY